MDASGTFLEAYHDAMMTALLLTAACRKQATLPCNELVVAIEHSTTGGHPLRFPNFPSTAQGYCKGPTVSVAPRLLHMPAEHSAELGAAPDRDPCASFGENLKYSRWCSKRLLTDPTITII